MTTPSRQTIDVLHPALLGEQRGQGPTPRWWPLKGHPEQQRALTCGARFVGLDAGRRSGKTDLAKRFLVSHLPESRPWPDPRFFYGMPTRDQAKRVAWRDLLKLIPDNWIIGGKHGPNVSYGELWVRTKWGSELWVLGMDAPARFEGIPWDGGVLDEACFAAGTLVDTPSGKKPIETIVPGELVFNASGVGTVERISSRIKTRLAIIKTAASTFVCSDNHRFLTRRGWVQAGSLTTGDCLVKSNEAVRIVRQADSEIGYISPETLLLSGMFKRMVRTQESGNLCRLPLHVPKDKRQTAMLFAKLCINSENVRSRLCKESSFPGDISQDQRSQTANDGGGHRRDGGCAQGAGRRYAPNEAAGDCCENGCDTSATRAPAQSTRRQRDWLDGTAEDGAFLPGRDFATGVDYLHGAPENTGQCAVLYHRHRYSIQDAGDRSRWGIAQDGETQDQRCDENAISGNQRVESVEIHESGSPEFIAHGDRDNTGRVTLYDLTVSGHPSYSVNGCIVHNCDLADGCFNLHVRPALETVENGINRHGWCWIIGKPSRRGPGAKWFKGFCEECRRGEYPDGAAFTWPSSDILPADVVAQARATMSKKDFDEQYGASWQTAGGGVWHAFSREFNVRPCQRRDNLPIIVGSDFNVDPMCWTLSHRVGEFFETFDELILRNSNTPRTLKELWTRYGHHPGGWQFYGDASSRQRQTSATQSNYAHIWNDENFQRAGRTLHYLNANPSHHDRFAAGNTRLGTADGLHRAFIDPRCTTLIEDLETRSYKEGTTELADGMEQGHACLVAGTLITTNRGMIPIEDVRVGDMAFTRIGYRPVSWAGITNPSAEIWRITTSDGVVVEGTADHPFWIVGHGFVPMNLIECGVSLYRAPKVNPCEEKQLFTTGQNTIGIRTRKASRHKDTLLAVVAVTHGHGVKPVYGLTVEDAHEYFANGILVKNSDAWSYCAHRIWPIRFNVGGNRKQSVIVGDTQPLTAGNQT